jgi:hypothetical protein
LIHSCPPRMTDQPPCPVYPSSTVSPAPAAGRRPASADNSPRP